MKYHKHIIKVVAEDLGLDSDADNKLYEISKDGEYINTAYTLDSAKNYIDSGYDDNML